MLKQILIGVGVVVVALVILVVAGLYVYPAQVVGATQQAAPDFTLKELQGRISIWRASTATESCSIFIADTGDLSA
jgi:hypothetical protein